MKNRLSNVTSIVLALAMLLTLALAAGCPRPLVIEEPPQEVEAPARYPLTITDSAGRTITIERPLERVLVLGASHAAALRLVGAIDTIIAATDSIHERARRFPELEGKPSIGGGWRPCVETILYFDPDAVFTWVRWPSPETLREAELEAAGIKVIRFDLFMIETQIQEKRILGEIFDGEAKLAAYIAWHEKYINLVKDRVADIPEEDRVRVFVEWYGRERELTRLAAGAGSGIHKLLVMAGGINIAADHIPGSSGDVEIEWVLAENPEVIIAYETMVGGFETDDPAALGDYYNVIKGLPGFSEKVDAVVDGRVHLIHMAVASGPALPVGLVYLARWLHPEKFADLDPQAIHQEFIDRFTGLDFDVRTQGVFVYPPPPVE